jgi:hypothetical protein
MELQAIELYTGKITLVLMLLALILWTGHQLEQRKPDTDSDGIPNYHESEV